MALKFHSKEFVILVVILYCAFDGVLGICNVTHCTDEKKCLKSRYKHSCNCAVGYYGDLCDKDVTIDVTCGKDHITVMVIEDFFKYHNVPVEFIHLKSNRSCGAYRDVLSGIPYYIVRISKDQYIPCGGKPLEKNATDIAYTLTLQSDPQIIGNISRNPRIHIEYTCIYPYKRIVSLQHPVNPFSSEAVIEMDMLKASVVIALFKSEHYREEYQGAPVIHLQDIVHVEVKVREPENFFDLRVDECWASQSPEPDKTEGIIHILVVNGCGSDGTVIFHTEETDVNGKGSATRYSFKMFRFVNEFQDIYLHCKVHLCAPDEHCTPDCKTKRKRAAVRGDPAQGVLSYGPIKINVPDTPKYSLWIMTVPVAGIWVLGFFLLALVTMAKAGNRRLSRLANR
ncbi:zona pellucida glycoprotein d [Esox lucius]|uniref:ZP domain-containing protein n=1 Tax=Esox lucius TaxID=8010 RepID=A0A3P9A438_ESOLU|nr:zona pellucida glycoprotein d [Esox lucius]